MVYLRLLISFRIRPWIQWLSRAGTWTNPFRWRVDPSYHWPATDHQLAPPCLRFLLDRSKPAPDHARWKLIGE
jgi:hypothetical protein